MVSREQEWEVNMSKLQMLTDLHLMYTELPLVLDPVRAGVIARWRWRRWTTADRVKITSHVLKIINSFNTQGYKRGRYGLFMQLIVFLTPGSSYYLFVSQSASATFCSAANSSGACAIWTGNLRKLPNSTRCKFCLCSGILPRWIGILYWGFGCWCTLQHLDRLNRRPTHVFVR